MLEIKDAEIEFIATEKAKFVDSVMEDFTLYDVSGYPNSKLPSFQPVKPYPLIGRVNKENPFGRILFALYNDKMNFYSSDRVNKLMEMDFFGVYAVY